MVLTDFREYLTDFDGGTRPPPSFDVPPPPGPGMSLTQHQHGGSSLPSKYRSRIGSAPVINIIMIGSSTRGRRVSGFTTAPITALSCSCSY